MTLLEELRLRARLTRDDLATKSGVPVRTIRNLESGQVRNPADRTIFPLADALEVEPVELMQSFRQPQAA